MQYTEHSVQKLRRAIDAGRRDMLAALEMLVTIDSGSYDSDGVDTVGDGLQALWEPLGFTAERVPLPGLGAQRTIARRFRGRGRILIVGHLDTVGPRGTSHDWPFREEDGLAYGPGVGDMKGGLVMAHAAIRALMETDFDGIAEIRHILVPDEELGSAASRSWIEAEARQADYILVLEPARASGAVVVGRGAVGALIVRAEGVSAHSTNIADGASALSALAGAVGPLEALSDPGRGDIVNVGILTGGDARQVVPAHCEMHIDLRAKSDDNARDLVARVQGILQAPADPRVRITLSGGITRPAFPRAASSALYAHAAACAEAIGIDYPAVESGGGSDGSFGAALGKPTLDGLGPVCFDACSRRERIVVESLVDRAAIMAALIVTLSEQNSLGASAWA